MKAGADPDSGHAAMMLWHGRTHNGSNDSHAYVSNTHARQELLVFIIWNIPVLAFAYLPSLEKSRKAVREGGEGGLLFHISTYRFNHTRKLKQPAPPNHFL